MHFIKALVKDVIEQSWTLLGMAIAWLVLEGSAKDLTLTLIGVTLLVWVVTFPLFRYEKEEKETTKKTK
jgi:aspartyl-tRNA synthetase